MSGENVPDQISSFQQCGLRTILLDNIKKSHYTTPTPVQKYAIPIILEGRDLMACAQTGSGKTVSYCIYFNLLCSEYKKKFRSTSFAQFILFYFVMAVISSLLLVWVSHNRKMSRNYGHS